MTVGHAGARNPSADTPSILAALDAMGRRRAELALQASPVRERLRRHAARLADRPIEEVCDALLDALRGGEVWDDDAIAVVARIRGRDDAAGPDPLAASPPPCFRLRP